MTHNTTSTLIKTKLLAPVNRSSTVARTKLVHIFLSSLNRKLILISAPAGFGKTTLLGQCFEAMKDSNVGLCWISLDENDNDPETFVRYVIAALRSVDDEIGREVIQYMDSASAPDIFHSLTSLANGLVMIDKEVYLFLDDFHLISSSEVNQFVELLLNLSPPNFHLIISGRVIPDLPLANMRAQNDLLQISADKLRFDAEESQSFLLKCHNLKLSEALLKTLYERCDGWAAGLQLASLSLRESTCHEEFIQSFSGNIRDIADYLAVTVLDQQPESIQAFLFGTAFLDRLNADLCNCLLDSEDSSELLQKLESDNLFIVPLDQERKWYRYHPLFREFLLAQMDQTQKANQQELNGKASHWFKEHGLLGEAVDYALRANDMSSAAELIEQRAIEEFMDGRMPRVASWINRIPKAVQLQHRQLMLLHGTALYHMNRSDDAAYICDQLEQSMAEINGRKGIGNNERNELVDEIAILRAGINMSLDNASEVIQSSPKELHSRQHFMEGVINNVKGYAYFVLGEFDAARKHISLARKVHRQIGSGFGMMYSDCFLGMLELSQGNLKRARQVIEQVQRSDSASERSPYIESAREVLLGVIDYEMNIQGESLDSLQTNLKTLEQVGHISLMHLGYITLAKYFSAKGNFDLGLKIMDYLTGLYFQSAVNLNHQLLVGYNTIKLLLRCDKRAEALRIASSMDISLDDTLPELPDKWNREAFQKQLVQARLWLAGGQQETLISVATRLYELAIQIGLGYRAIECLLLLSQAQMKSGNKSEAIAAMKQALCQAVANNIIRIFVDEGLVILPILKLVEASLNADESMLLDFTGEIIRAFEPDVQSRNTQQPGDGHMAGLVEPLSQREMDVLRLMGEGKSNAHIAEILHISENTVKWHGRNVLAKLCVKNRTEAVITAQDLGLLDTR